MTVVSLEFLLLRAKMVQAVVEIGVKSEMLMLGGRCGRGATSRKSNIQVYVV